MPKNKISISTRANEFSSDGFYIHDFQHKLMMCRFCNTRVDWEKKSICDSHCETTKHISAKEKVKIPANQIPPVYDSALTDDPPLLSSSSISHSSSSTSLSNLPQGPSRFN